MQKTPIYIIYIYIPHVSDINKVIDVNDVNERVRGKRIDAQDQYRATAAGAGPTTTMVGRAVGFVPTYWAVRLSVVVSQLAAQRNIIAANAF
jgi:hypothetical protein